MSLYTVKSVQPGVTVELGWQSPYYYFALYGEGDNPLRSNLDLITLYDLVDETAGIVDWPAESETLARLRDDPWIERATAVGRHGPAEVIGEALRSAVTTT